MNKNEYYSFRTTPYSSVPIGPSCHGRHTNPTRERGRHTGCEMPVLTHAPHNRMRGGHQKPSAPIPHVISEIIRKCAAQVSVFRRFVLIARQIVLTTKYKAAE